MSTRRTAKVACQPEWCPVERTLAIIGGVWKVIIIRELLTGTKRYGQLHRALRGVTHKMLTQQLRELERDGDVPAGATQGRILAHRPGSRAGPAAPGDAPLGERAPGAGGEV